MSQNRSVSDSLKGTALLLTPSCKNTHHSIEISLNMITKLIGIMGQWSITLNPRIIFQNKSPSSYWDRSYMNNYIIHSQVKIPKGISEKKEVRTDNHLVTLKLLSQIGISKTVKTLSKPWAIKKIVSNMSQGLPPAHNLFILMLKYKL